MMDVLERGTTKSFCVQYVVRLGVTPENVYGIITHRSWKYVT